MTMLGTLTVQDQLELREPEHTELEQRRLLQVGPAAIDRVAAEVAGGGGGRVSPERAPDDER
eukprot:3769311-Prymnesium_polylepis.1